jgi:SAM-dependent methyltransferase
MSPNIKNRDGNRRVEGDRLLYYKSEANVEHWENLWQQSITAEMYEPFKAGKLFEFEKIFLRHLPRTGKILEAGCGMSQFVLALASRGYDCFGLDYAFQALHRAKQFSRSLRLTCGDITALSVAGASVSAVISIGVVEHRFAGPEPFLKEMYRVLEQGGLMLISVPYFNPLRRWRAQHAAYQDDISGLGFYQYAFTREEFCGLLTQSGFEIEKTYTYSHQSTLRQELHWLKRLPMLLQKLVLRVSKYVPYVNSQLGHMLMVVARKRD